MGFDIPATVEIKTGNLQNKQDKVMGLNGENISPILVSVDGFNHYFHWSQLKVVKETTAFKFYPTFRTLTVTKVFLLVFITKKSEFIYLISLF